LNQIKASIIKNKYLLNIKSIKSINLLNINYFNILNLFNIIIKLNIREEEEEESGASPGILYFKAGRPVLL
jgi:hypothetical protein